MSALPEFNTTITDEVIVHPAAHEKLVELLNAEEDINGVRIFVTGGGCGGMSYGMTFAEAPSAYDAVLEKDGLTLYIDAVALGPLAHDEALGGGLAVFGRGDVVDDGLDFGGVEDPVLVPRHEVEDGAGGGDLVAKDRIQANYVHPWSGAVHQMCGENFFGDGFSHWCAPHSESVFNTDKNADWGISTWPTIFIRFLPFFCFSNSLRLRVMSPP